MFAQSTKHNRLDDGNSGKTRDRSAPMDFAFEKPRDPGVFGVVPHKRQHIETADGQSTWTPGPFTDSSSTNTTFTHAGPMLFAQPPSARNQDAGDVSMGMDVDNSMREDPGDVDMYSDSPAKPARSSEHALSGSEDLQDSKINEASKTTASSLLSSSLRPINGNAVKRVEKQRSKVPSSKTAEQTSGTNAHGEGALILRESLEQEHGPEGNVTDDSFDEGEGAPLHSYAAATPAIRRRRQRHDISDQSSGNRYTLNVFGHNGQSALGVVPSPSHLPYMQDSKGKVNHSELPYILLGYLQFIFNASIVGVCLYLVLMFLWTIRNDVKERMATYSSEILQEISTCTNLYLVNRCEPATRIPAMETSCLEWEHCMNRDPTVVGHAKVGAEMFAGVISGFVDELSWKTIFFLLCTMTCLVFVTNSALFTIRARHAQSHDTQSMTGGHHYPEGGYPGARPPQVRDFEWPPVSHGPASGGRSVSSSSEKR